MTRFRILFCFCFGLADLLAQTPFNPHQVAATGAIEGSVIDSVTGSPVRKAQVTLGGQSKPAMLLTDATGRFSVRELPSGQFQIQASHPNYPNRAGAVSLSVRLEPGESKRELVIRLIPGSALTGKVMDQDGEPLVGCHVEALRPVTRSASPQQASGITNDRGEYRLFHVLPGRYYLRASCLRSLPVNHWFDAAEGISPSLRTYGTQYFGGGASPEGATRVSVLPGAERTGLDFRLTPQTLAAVRGQVKGVQEAALQGGVLVSLVSTDRQLALLGTRNMVRVNPRNGRFHLPNLAAGAYQLQAGTVGENERMSSMQDVTVNAGTVNEVTVLLQPAVNLSGNLAVEADGASANLAGYQVFLQRVVEPYFGGSPAGGKVQADGSFQLEGVTAGDWRVEVNGPGYIRSVRLGGEEAPARLIRVTPGSGGPLEIRVGTQTGTVAGTVSGANAKSARLLLRSTEEKGWTNQQTVHANADATGHFRLANLHPGEYRLIAIAGEAPNSPLDEEIIRALQPHSSLVRIGEGETVNVQAAVISPETLAEVRNAIDSGQFEP